MSGARTATPDAHATQGKVQLVVHHPELVGRQVGVAKSFRHGLAGEIHVRLGQDEPDAARFRMTHQRLPPLAIDLRIHAPRQLPHARKTEIVARVGVLRLRIAQPDDQPLFLIQFTSSK